MSAWRDHVKDWLEATFTKHDDTYLAERLARACEDERPYLGRHITAALRDYRAQNPRQS